MALQQARQRARLRGRIVHAREHHVFEGHAAAVLLIEVMPARPQQLRDRMLAVDRHQLVAQRIIGRVQRHGQRHVGLSRELVDLGHQPRGRQRHAAPRQIEAEVIEQDAQRGHHVAEVGERLAHPHQHDVADAALVPGCAHRARRGGERALRFLALELAHRQPHLPHHLGGAQVAIEALPGRGAERAVQRTADLRGNAQRAAIGLGNEHHLERLGCVGAQQPLAGAIARALLREDLRCAHLGLRGKQRAEVPGEIGHVLERADAALVHPVHQLARAERLAAEPRHEALECRTRQPQQVGARCCCRCHGGAARAPNRADAAPWC